MVIGMTKGYVDFMYKGKIVRGWGDMCDKYFCIIASTIEWIFPGKRHRLNDLERDEFIEEVKRCEYELRKKYRMAFEDDNGKMIKKKIKKGKRKSKKEIENSRLEAKSLEDLDWNFYQKIILSAKNEVNMFERKEMLDNNRKYFFMKEAITEHASLITVNKYLLILGTSDSVYESTIKFSDLYKTIFKDEKNIIAHDIFGGLFAEEKASLGKKIYYLAPDSLEWEETEISYSKRTKTCFVS